MVVGWQMDQIRLWPRGISGINSIDSIDRVSWIYVALEVRGDSA